MNLLQKTNPLKEVEENVQVLINLISKSEDLNILIKNPTCKQDEQLKIINFYLKNLI